MQNHCLSAAGNRKQENRILCGTDGVWLLLVEMNLKFLLKISPCTAFYNTQCHTGKLSLCIFPQYFFIISIFNLPYYFPAYFIKCSIFRILQFNDNANSLILNLYGNIIVSFT